MKGKGPRLQQTQGAQWGRTNAVLVSCPDELGRSTLTGLGFTLAICLVASVREALGNGTLWDYPWMPGWSPVRYVPASILIQAPGAFLVLGLLLASYNLYRGRKARS